jgi:hypothetical protein
MTAEDLLPHLEAVRRGSRGYRARCPAHDDKTPSLSIREGKRGLLIHCFAGCSLDEVTAALSIRVADLFFDGHTSRGHRLTPQPVKIDRVALAFRFELAAIDRRLRAERVLQAVNNISINELPDHDLDRLVDAAARAYADIERAELFEGVADGLRAKAFARKEGTVSHAASC